MTFDQAVPIIEGKLYAYAVRRKEYPGPAASPLAQALDDMRELGTTIRGPLSTESPQERWIVANQREIMDDEAIGRCLRSFDETTRKVIAYRYAGGKSWKAVAALVHLSERAVYNVRKRALKRIGKELGLIQRRSA